MNDWVFIQARSTSTRLPNKCMAEIGGIPIIEHVFCTCDATCPGRVLIVMPTGDGLSEWCKEKGVPFFEGPEADVLLRFYLAAVLHGATAITRITADCPLLPVAQLAFCQQMLATKTDFYTNFPTVDGFDVEAMSFRALEWAYKNATTQYDREHVTTFIKSNLAEFKKQGMAAIQNVEPYLSEWGIPKLSVDTQEDLERVRGVYAKLVGAKMQYV